MQKMGMILALLLIGTSFANKKDKDPERCTRNISFAAASQNGVHPYMEGWIENWIRKNAHKHPQVCFSQEPQKGLINFSIILSDDPQEFNGLQATLITTTTPYSASGYVSSGGETWRYSYSGTVSTTSQVAVPYTIRRNTLYATAYLADVGNISQRSHLYETQEGGDDQEALATNLGNAFRAINARGRLLTGIVKDIEVAYVPPIQRVRAIAESVRRARGDYSGPPRENTALCDGCSRTVTHGLHDYSLTKPYEPKPVTPEASLTHVLAPKPLAPADSPEPLPAPVERPPAQPTPLTSQPLSEPSQNRSPTERETYCKRYPRGIFREDDGSSEYCDVRDDPANQVSKSPAKQQVVDQRKTPVRRCILSSTDAKGTTCIEWASK